jgi:hypothetical protein
VPFQDKNIGRFGLTRPNNLATSAEEFPFESADVLDETGRLVFIFPVSKVAQDRKLLPITSTWYIANSVILSLKSKRRL